MIHAGATQTCILAIVCVSLCLVVDYGPSAWPAPSEHSLIGCLTFLTAYLHLLVIGCHSLPCLSCLGRQIEAVMLQNPEPDCHCDWIWIWSHWQSGAVMFFLSQACLLHQMLSYLCVCNTLVWLAEGSKTFCNLIAVLLTPFHWSLYLCMFSLQPKVFSCCCSQPQSTLSLSLSVCYTLSQVLKIGGLDLYSCVTRELLYCCMKHRDLLSDCL